MIELTYDKNSIVLYKEKGEKTRNKYYFKDPLVYTHYDSSNNAKIFVFYRNVQNFKTLKYSMEDTRYENEDYSTYYDIFNRDYDPEDTENVSFEVKNSIREVFYVVVRKGEAVLTYMYPILYLDKEDIRKSIVMIYPHGNAYHNSYESFGSLCWGELEGAKINSIGDWFMSKHNADLLPLVRLSNDALDSVIEMARDYDIEFMYQSLFMFVAESVEGLYNTVDEILKSVLPKDEKLFTLIDEVASRGYYCKTFEELLYWNL